MRTIDECGSRRHVSMVSIEQTRDGFQATISAPRNRTSLRVTAGFTMFFGLMWVAIVIDGLRQPPVSPGIVFATLLFGTGATGLLWQVGGRQRISVDADSLTLRWSFLGIGYSRRFGIASVSDLHAVGSGPFALSCNVAGEIVRFGQGVDQFAARRIVAMTGVRHPLIVEAPEP